MRAVGFTESGGPEVLRLVELPEPHAGPGEVRIRVHAAAVNPADTLRRAGTSSLPVAWDGPQVPGMDAAGVVDEAPEGVGWRVGERVLAVVSSIAARQGTYADYVVVPAESVTRLPDGIDFVAGSTLLMNGLTARLALDLLALPSGDTVLVTGSAGAVGSYAIELAVLAGLRVVADPAVGDEAFVRGAGADVVVARGDGFAERVRSVVPEGVGGVVDGADLREAVVPAIRDGGGIATLRRWDGVAGPGILVHPVMVGTVMRETHLLDELARLAGEGLLTLRVSHVLDPVDAPTAHRLMEAGGLRGRVVLDFSH